MLKGKLKRGWCRTDYKDMPPRLTDEQRQILVKRLQDDLNTVEVEQLLVEGHMRLVVSICAKYCLKWYSKNDEIYGAAMLSLVEAVHEFKSCGKDNNITGYIVHMVHVGIMSALRNDRLIPTSKNYFHENYKTIHRYQFEDATKIEHKSLAYTSKTEQELIFKEKLSKLKLTALQANIIKGLMSGEKQIDIAKRLGYTRAHISKIFVELVQDLRWYFQGE